MSESEHAPALKKRNEDAFRAARAEISGLREQAAAGQIVLGYLDEAGFCAVHPNRSAWTPVSTQHLIPAIRGQRHNVLAALMSTGHLESTQFTGSMTSDTLIIDNASVHRSRKVNTQMVLLEQKGGVKLYFLPPYIPELNRIEKLWQQMKYVWMGVKCRTLEMLNQDVSDILDDFGVNLKLSF